MKSEQGRDNADLVLSEALIARTWGSTGWRVTRFKCHLPESGSPDPTKTTEASAPPTCSASTEGDTSPPRRRTKKDSTVALTIRHQMATPLSDVGLQIWNGALLLCDYIVSNPELFANRGVLELGAGIGLSGFVAARFAERVYITDRTENILQNCQHNAVTNSWFFDDASKVRVRELDWGILPMRNPPGNPVAEPSEFQWSRDDLDYYEEKVDILIAADVIYDDAASDALVKALESLLSGKLKRRLLLATEKRINFSLVDLDVKAHAHEYFLKLVVAPAALPTDLAVGTVLRGSRFIAARLSTDFPSRFEYERVKELEMWEITVNEGETLANQPKWREPDF